MHVFEPQRLKGAGKLGRDAPRSWGGGEAGTESQGGRSLEEPRFVLPACQINGRRLPHSAHGERAAPKRGIPQATVPALPPSLPPSGPIRSLRLSVQSSWSGSRPAFAGLWKSLRGRRDVPRALRRSLHPLQTARPGGVAHTSQLGVRKTVPLDRAEEGATTETFSGCAFHVPLGSPELLKCGWCD